MGGCYRTPVESLLDGGVQKVLPASLEEEQRELVCVGGGTGGACF